MSVCVVCDVENRFVQQEITVQDLPTYRYTDSNLGASGISHSTVFSKDLLYLVLAQIYIYIFKNFDLVLFCRTREIITFHMGCNTGS